MRLVFVLFYKELATRPGIPTTMDVVVASMGLVLLLEATRRSLGAPMAVLAIVFIAYIFLGPGCPMPCLTGAPPCSAWSRICG
ncbi:hypothetical protein [Alcaligenes faecalis]|uniref:hypothetical protein n=1 Tax=Alcaligenes faecalis TaxID=511 RepID=UPI0024BCC4AF|nr:hypothetical protein [Alcaligenes faecalis]